MWVINQPNVLSEEHKRLAGSIQNRRECHRTHQYNEYPGAASSGAHA